MNESGHTLTRRIITHEAAPSAADPWIVAAPGGGWYYCRSGGGAVKVSYSKNLSDLFTARERERTVWTPPAGTAYSHELWAPELHFLRGSWYIYVAADDGKNAHHRMHVLRATDPADPTAPFEYVGQIGDATDNWAIDGTVFVWQDELYFVWSGWEGDVNVAQNLYIAHMSDPTTVDSARVCLSRPELPWEANCSPKINEGPAAVVGDGCVRLVYSASGSWLDSYCLGCLSFDGGDVMDPAAWKKSPAPLFTPVEGSYGPGHCSFAEAPDGRLWIFFHANKVSGSGWRGRSLRMQPVEHWDGRTLILGRVLSPAEPIEVPVTEE